MRCRVRRVTAESTKHLDAFGCIGAIQTCLYRGHIVSCHVWCFSMGNIGDRISNTKRYETPYDAILNAAAQACFTSRVIRRRKPEAKEWRRCSNSCQNFRVFPAFMGLDWVVVRTNDCEKIEKINKDMELNGGFQSSKIAHRPCSFQYDTHVFGESPFYIRNPIYKTQTHQMSEPIRKAVL